MTTEGGPPPERPPLLPAQRALEAALAAVVVLFALWQWSLGLALTAAPAASAPDSMQRLGELQREGRGGLPAAIMAVVSLGALVALASVLRRAARGVLAALPPGEPRSPGRVLAVAAAWWRERTAGLERHAVTTLSVGHFLVVFGLMQVAQEPALLLVPPGRVEVDGERFDVNLRAAHDVAPLGTAVQAKFFATVGAVSAKVTGGPVRVDGALRGPGVLSLRDGATVEVGDRRVVVRAPSPAGQLAALALGLALSVVVVVGAAALLGGRALLERLGLTARGLPRELRRGALGFLAVLPVYFAVLVAWTALGQALGAPGQGHALVELLEREGPGLAPVIALQAVVLAPLREELLFRALLLPALARVVGVAGAVAASAFVFATAHSGFLALAPMFVLGALFAGLYATSPERSLVGAITAHALFNGLNLLLVVTVQLS